MTTSFEWLAEVRGVRLARDDEAPDLDGVSLKKDKIELIRINN